MQRCDAAWVGELLAKYPTDQLSPLLSIGSGSREHRERKQPFIDQLALAPLRKRGVRIVNCDVSPKDGIDIAGDVYDDAAYARMRAVQANAVLCTHVLEHVPDREEFARRLTGLLQPGGLFVITVPSSYHEHTSFDTLYRPTPDELAALFAPHSIVAKTELVGETYWATIRRRPLIIPARHLIRFFFPFVNWKMWKRSMRKLYWLFHPYKVAAVAGRKTA